MTEYGSFAELAGESPYPGIVRRGELSAGTWSVVPGEVVHGITAGRSGARFLAILVPPRKEPLS